MDNIPSTIRPYLEEISQCLWSKNASIMIGAGFSMNASPIFENAKKFPSWQDLGNIFYRKVRGEDIKGALYNFYDPLKLAYEVEANFGRPVLDAILRTNIPDSDYSPSSLHHALLSLPWTDIFTTNYDTLLERAADTVSERNYKIVVNKDDLVHSIPPRIFKLHGCFSASTHFIISEEDYRTYPQKYAPFVNTVQQTLLENTLVLIGFSGDDPNFLKWIGWIRDNLGEKNSPKIYLIGVLNLSTAQEKALAQYNITCIDMSLCDGVEKKDHYSGIKRFIDYCSSKRDFENKNDWRLSSEFMHSQFEHKKNASAEELISELTLLTKLWYSERLAYPNWIVAPSEKRQKLWSYTKNWSRFFDKKVDLNQNLLTCFIYEYLWRKEKSLLPIFDDEVELVKISICFDGNKITNIDTQLEKKHFIILALLRYFREEGKKEDWNRLFLLSSEAIKDTLDNNAFFNEKALMLLFDNNTTELMQLLTAWNTSSSSPYWMYRKASILSEIGNISDAQEQLEQALIKTRKKINSTSLMIDYSNVSLESYIIVLLTVVNRAISFQAGSLTNKKDPYEDRLYELRQYHCNPRQEQQLIELEIKHEPIIQKAKIVKNGFDIGSQQTIHNFASGNDEALNAFRFLRFFEDAGFPFSLPNGSFAVTGASNAIKRVAIFAPYWSMCTMLRTRNEKSIESIFTRESLSRFNSDFINALASKYIQLLSNYINNEKCLYNYGMFLPEALSRLCCRCNSETKDKILELINSIYSSTLPRPRYSGIDKLIKRVLSSFSNEDIYYRLEKITEISYHLFSNNANENAFHFLPNPFDFLLNASIPTNMESSIKIPSEFIKNILDYVGSKNIELRQASSLTLIRLKALGLLNKNQTKSLLSKLLLDKDEYGLPKNTIFYKFAYINIFEQRSDIISGLRLYLLKERPYSQTLSDEPNSYGLSGRADSYTKELVGCRNDIIWSKEELGNLAKKIIYWWESDKEKLTANKDHEEIHNEILIRFSLLPDCIDIIFVKNDIFEYKEKLASILAEFIEKSINHFYLKAVLLDYLKIDQRSFLYEIEEGLSSFKDGSTINALKAVNLLLTRNVEIYEDLIKIFSCFIRYARSTLLSSALEIVSTILKNTSVQLSFSIEKAVLDVIKRIIDGYDELSFEENLELQESAASIASQLYSFYKAKNITIPLIILKWKDICLSKDTFSEIKNKWDNID